MLAVSSGLAVAGVVVALAVWLMLYLFRREDLDRAEEEREADR